MTAEQRHNATTLVRREGEAPVPPGTRRIRVTLTSQASAPVSSALAVALEEGSRTFSLGLPRLRDGTAVA